MKSRILFLLLCLLIPETVFAELSVTNKWRIEQAVQRCGDSDNDLKYTEYWQGAVTDENREAVCMAERVAEQIAAEGDAWLEKGAVELIRQCYKRFSLKDRKPYFSCLRSGVEQVTKGLTSTCKELGATKLWDERRCRRLVSFIFVQKFEKVLGSKGSLLEKIIYLNNKIERMAPVRILFNPLMAVIWFMVFVLDIVMVTDPGNWMKISRIGLIVGPIILVSCFFKGGIRYVSAGSVIIVLVLVMMWNHRDLVFGFEKKK